MGQVGAKWTEKGISPDSGQLLRVVKDVLRDSMTCLKAASDESKYNQRTQAGDVTIFELGLMDDLRTAIQENPPKDIEGIGKKVADLRTKWARWKNKYSQVPLHHTEEEIAGMMERYAIADKFFEAAEKAVTKAKEQVSQQTGPSR